MDSLWYRRMWGQVSPLTVIQAGVGEASLLVRVGHIPRKQGSHQTSTETVLAVVMACAVSSNKSTQLAPGRQAHTHRPISPANPLHAVLSRRAATGQTPSCHSEPRVGGPRSSSSFSCTCICITNYFFSLTDKDSFSLCDLTTTQHCMQRFQAGVPPCGLTAKLQQGRPGLNDSREI
jgi:hypothetical protein